MGKSTGFLDYNRELNPSVDPKVRITNFNEFINRYQEKRDVYRAQDV